MADLTPEEIDDVSTMLAVLRDYPATVALDRLAILGHIVIEAYDALGEAKTLPLADGMRLHVARLRARDERARILAEGRTDG